MKMNEDLFKMIGWVLFDSVTFFSLPASSISLSFSLLCDASVDQGFFVGIVDSVWICSHQQDVSTHLLRKMMPIRPHLTSHPCSDQGLHCTAITTEGDSNGSTTATWGQ